MLEVIQSVSAVSVSQLRFWFCHGLGVNELGRVGLWLGGWAWVSVSAVFSVLFIRGGKPWQSLAEAISLGPVSGDDRVMLAERNLPRKVRTGLC
jgi:hypothetical protein